MQKLKCTLFNEERKQTVGGFKVTFGLVVLGKEI